MSDDRHTLDPEIAAELEALGEAPPEDGELVDASALAEVLGAIGRGPAAIEALETEPDRDSRLQTPLAGLHRLRGAAGGDVLTEARRDALWANVAKALPQQEERPAAKVIPFFRRPQTQVFLAAAAAVLLAVFLGVFASIDGPDNAPQGIEIAQIELDRAEERLRTVEKDSLKALMAAQKAPAGPSGDHYLRDLRKARFDAVRARRQARARRL